MSSFDRKRAEKLARALRELNKREERALYEGSLRAFVGGAWSSMDSSEFQSSWALDALCDHLEAVTRGHIKRLLINFPPRCGKSNVASIAWPAWVWAQSQTSFVAGPSVRFLCGSYNHTLALQHSNATRRLLGSSFYQNFWGDRFSLMSDQNAKTQYDTDKGGKRIATSVGGTLVGLGGDVILCFPGSEIVWTDKGPLRIGDVVDGRLECRALSLNPDTGTLEYRRVVGWHRNPGRPLVRVHTDDGGGVTCTTDHRVLTSSGYVEASLLGSGDTLLAAPRRMRFSSADVAVAQRQIEVRPYASVPDACDGGHADTELCGEDARHVIMASRNCSDDLLGQVRRTVAKRAVTLGVGDVLGARAVFEVAEAAVRRVSILVANLVSGRAWTDERCHDFLVNPALDGLSVLAGVEPRVAFGGRGLDRFGLQEIRPAVLLENRSADGSDATHVRDLVNPIIAHERAPEFLRVVRVEHLSEVPLQTYCLTVEGNNNLCCGELSSIVCSNCDDPHNTESVESEAEREKTMSWWKELSSTRLNDPKKSAIVVVMQRLHEQDVSGAILDGDEEYVHLMLPMRYVPKRHCVTILGPGKIWQDPRLETKEDLLWPERYGEKEVKSLESKLGPYMASGRLQQLPSPAGGGIFKEEWWGKYEVEVGAPFPHQMVFRVGSLDPAYTAKQENDPSGWVVFGVYFDDKRNPRIVLLNAWEKWLELHGEDVEPKSGESNAAYVRRAKEKWGLVEWVAHESKRHRVNTLLVEDKASGHSVAQEIRRLYGDEDWGVRLINPGSLDKRARAYAVQHLFANGIIQAPASRNAKGDLVFRPWAQEVIDQASKFRGLSGDEDNIIDAMTQCLSFMRETGWAMRTDEVRRETDAAMTHKPQKAPIYDV